MSDPSPQLPKISRITLPVKVILAGLLSRPMYAAELSRVTQVPEPSVSRIVDRLVTQGWAVKHEPDHGPSRPPRISIEVTDEGREAAASLGVVAMGRPEQIQATTRVTFSIGL